MKRRNYFIQHAVIAIFATFLWTLILCFNAAHALVIPSAIDNDNDRVAYQIKQFSIETPANLKVRTSGGFIEAYGHNGSEVEVRVYVQKNGDYLSPEDIDLSGYELAINHSGQNIEAIAKRKDRWKGNKQLSISFEVHVPRQTSTDLATSGGHITSEGLEGQQDLRTSGGHLNLTDLQGEIDARTSGGHINLEQLSGNIQVRTSGGHINADKITGTTELKTSGGHLNLEKIAGTLDARTSGGHINVSIEEFGDHLTLKTSGGNIHVEIPSGIGINLDLEGNRVQSELKNFNGTVKDHRINGTLHGGGPELAAQTSGGIVRVSYR